MSLEGRLGTGRRRKQAQVITQAVKVCKGRRTGNKADGDWRQVCVRVVKVRETTEKAGVDWEQVHKEREQGQVIRQVIKVCKGK